MRDGRAPVLPVLAWASVVALALLVLPWVGAEDIGFDEVIAFLRGSSTVGGTIFFRLRLPRVLLALTVGGALSVTGAALQVLFRNPLAEPWTLGVSGGAALGAFAAHAFGATRVVGLWPSTPLMAMLGAAGAMAIVWSLSRRHGTVNAHTLLLAGVSMSVVSGSAIMLATYFLSPFNFVSFHRWTMGGLDIVGYRDLWAVALLAGPGLVVLWSMAREYDQIAFGEEMAAGHGVDVARVHRLTFIGAGIVTAGCVAMAGPIGFVGMIVPHIVRRASGFEHRRLLPAAFLLGGTVLAVCDTVARTAIAPTEIPVGIVTAVIGGPVFLFLLGRR